MQVDNRGKHFSKLEPFEVEQIKAFRLMGVTRAFLAKKYGVTAQAIKAIDLGLSYRYIEPRAWHWG